MDAGERPAPVDDGEPQELGDRVKLVVRPERLALLGPAEDAPNVLDGALREVILVGGVTKYYVTLADGRAVSATRLTAGPPGSISADGKVRVGWAIDSTVVLSE